VHANASLFKAPEIKRAVQTGQAQMGELLLSIHENEDAVYGIDVVPFLAVSFPDAMKLYKASKPAIEKKLAAQGIMLLMAVPWAPQGIYVKKDLNTIDDMKGLKWRAYNVGTARIGEIVGAQSVTVQAAELPQALATGVVNSFMSSGGTGYDSKVWESLTHFYDTQAWIPKNYTIVNKAAFDALDKPTQEAIVKAAATAEARGWKAWQDKSGWYLDQLKAKGMKVQAPSDVLATGFKKVGEQLTQDWLKKAGADGQAIVEAYKKM
jgi:TRAP-type C4-dicarboxylate transport system substrate-binding protein